MDKKPLKPSHNETAEEHRRHIAQVAEECSHLEGNIDGGDFEEFALKYGFDKGSDFA